MMSNNSRSRARTLLNAANQYGLQLTLGTIPRMYYGNDAGLFNNRRSLAELAEFQRRAPTKSQHPVADFIRREGYSPYEPKYDRELLRSLHKRYQALITDSQHSKAIGPRLRDAARGIVDPARVIPEIQELLTPEVRTIFEAYYGTHLKVKHVRAWRNVHVPGEYQKIDVYSNLWHNDPHPVTTMRYFVYMTDGVTRDTGATQLHPMPRTKDIIRHGYLRRRAIIGKAREMIEDRSGMAFFEGNVGSAFFLNPQLCLHRAGVPPPGGHRDIIQFTIAPSDRPLARNWVDQLGPDPDAVK